MLRRSAVWFIAIVMVAVLGTTFFALPLSGSEIYLSPDETATAVAARSFSASWSFGIKDGLLRFFPWAHPRSFVVQGERLLPVGFLGLPALYGSILRFIGDSWLAFLTPILALSAVIPIYSFSRSWGRMAAFAAMATWLSFPTVILYANRGLFPNLPALCLAIWSSWLVWRHPKPQDLFLAGIIAGLAGLIRPTEVVWIIPLLIIARLEVGRWNIIGATQLFLGFFLILLLGLFLNWIAYGFPLTVGYLLKDTDIVLSGAGNVPSPVSNKPLIQSWPFGFHPRNVWFNFKSYYLFYLVPWTTVLFGSAILAWKKKENRRLIMLGAWIITVVVLVNGQGIYQDHVRLNEVSLANSFLRYTVAFGFIVALSAGWLAGWMTRTHRFGKIASAFIFVVLIFLGLWTAFVRDDEGLAKNLEELERYHLIRTEARRLLPAESYVLSPRSDKIFFPEFRAVSPLPAKEKIAGLIGHEWQVAIFERVLTLEQEEEWRKAGIGLIKMLESGNESLYAAYRL